MPRSRFREDEFNDIIFSDGQEGVVTLKNHEFMKPSTVHHASSNLNFTTFDNINQNHQEEDFQFEPSSTTQEQNESFNSYDQLMSSFDTTQYLISASGPTKAIDPVQNHIVTKEIAETELNAQGLVKDFKFKEEIASQEYFNLPQPYQSSNQSSDCARSLLINNKGTKAKAWDSNPHIVTQIHFQSNTKGYKSKTKSKPNKPSTTKVPPPATQSHNSSDTPIINRSTKTSRTQTGSKYAKLRSSRSSANVQVLLTSI